MAEEIEQAILSLLTADLDQRKKATMKLNALLEHSSSLMDLSNVISTSNDAKVVKAAAVILKRKMLEHTLSGTASEIGSCKQMSEKMLLALNRLPEKSICHVLCELYSVVVQYVLRIEPMWPEPFKFLLNNVYSEESANREMGMTLLCAISRLEYDMLKQNKRSMVSMSLSVMNNAVDNSLLPFAIKSLLRLIHTFGSECLDADKDVVVKVVNALTVLATSHSYLEEAIDSLQMLGNSTSNLLKPYLKDVVSHAVKVAEDKTTDLSTRIKGLTILRLMITENKINGWNLLKPILHSAFSILCDEEEEGEKTVSSAAGRVLHCLALYLRPKKIVPAMMRLIEPALKTTDPCRRRGAFLAIAVAFQGCADCFKTEPDLLVSLRKHVRDGMMTTTGSADVRRSASFAFGGLAMCMQPNEFSEDLPLFWECLSETSSETHQTDIVRSVYAIELICARLGKEVGRHKEQFMPILLEFGQNSSVKSVECAVHVIECIAKATPEVFLPFFDDTMELLKQSLMTTADDFIKIAALETLGHLARTHGETFRPRVSEVLTLGNDIYRSTDNSALKKAICDLFGVAAAVLKQDVSEVFVVVADILLDSAQGPEADKDKNLEEACIEFDSEVNGADLGEGCGSDEDFLIFRRANKHKQKLATTKSDPAAEPGLPKGCRTPRAALQMVLEIPNEPIRTNKLIDREMYEKVCELKRRVRQLEDEVRQLKAEDESDEIGTEVLFRTSSVPEGGGLTDTTMPSTFLDSKLKEAECLQRFGEVNVEREQYAETVANFSNCLALLESTVELSSRHLAETHCQVALAHGYNNAFDDSIAHYRSAVKIIELKIAELQVVLTEANNSDDANGELIETTEKEIEEMQNRILEIQMKICSTEEEKKALAVTLQFFEPALASGDTEPSEFQEEGFSSSQLLSTSDVELPVLILSQQGQYKRKLPEEERTEVDAKKAKSDAQIESEPVEATDPGQPTSH